MKAYASNIRISPKKIAVVATIVRNMEVQKALDILKYMPNKGSSILYKVLFSAVSNAVNNDGQEKDNLVISSLIIAKGVVMKRGNPIGRGRSHPILKRTSNILLELKVK
ncbi:MAG: 50S ribosomal protein L22 [Candidatus Gracilibacteria bacterium]|nr:50S ribosomal protein L22 [Candidatus Gracilibacteria bacterium]